MFQDKLLSLIKGVAATYESDITAEPITITEAQARITSLFEELIGEDEPNVQEGDHDKYTPEQLERLIPIRQRLNRQKHELRQALTGERDE